MMVTTTHSSALAMLGTRGSQSHRAHRHMHREERQYSWIRFKRRLRPTCSNPCLKLVCWLLGTTVRKVDRCTGTHGLLAFFCAAIMQHAELMVNESRRPSGRSAS